ncbi:hypothetical protein BELL_0603g00040 [Botrytis elliptica]|uniref:Uncharacterized protein n=1 Tax=Botrytis elliptica TaxID=278938 RepID=A0A4Z1JQR7_9HELO|nr:hypothetical protein BELL_0603g00040 [Botrytis elliptica]
MVFSLAQTCTPSTFSPSSPVSEILVLEANLVTYFDASVASFWRSGTPTVERPNTSFCNTTITYTHPRQNDSIMIEGWLPTDKWNGCLQAVGGGGWAGSN